MKPPPITLPAPASQSTSYAPTSEEFSRMQERMRPRSDTEIRLEVEQQETIRQLWVMIKAQQAQLQSIKEEAGEK